MKKTILLFIAIFAMAVPAQNKVQFKISGYNFSLLEFATLNQEIVKNMDSLNVSPEISFNLNGKHFECYVYFDSIGLQRAAVVEKVFSEIRDRFQTGRSMIVLTYKVNPFNRFW